jgi:hypothetical protein
MKIYLAGNLGVISREIQYRNLFKRRLLSFYEIINKLFASDQSFNLIIKINHARTKEKS